MARIKINRKVRSQIFVQAYPKIVFNLMRAEGRFQKSRVRLDSIWNRPYGIK